MRFHIGVGAYGSRLGHTARTRAGADLDDDGRRNTRLSALGAY